MKIIIGCECSGIVREEFRKLGNDAWSCDLKPAEDNSPHHLQCDVLSVLNNGWDLALFHPTCTYLTCSAEWAYTDGPYHQKVKPDTLVGAARRAAREDAVEFFRLLLNAPINRIAIENPTGVISTRIRPYDQRIQPYEYGDDASKGTCLWLKNLPLLNPTKYIKPRMVCNCGRVYKYDDDFKFGCPECGAGNAKPRWANQTDSGQNNLSPSDNRATDRSRTYAGIAKAIASQWGSL